MAKVGKNENKNTQTRQLNAHNADCGSDSFLLPGYVHLQGLQNPAGHQLQVFLETNVAGFGGELMNTEVHKGR